MIPDWEPTYSKGIRHREVSYLLSTNIHIVTVIRFCPSESSSELA
jgi:hypothetical protein